MVSVHIGSSGKVPPLPAFGILDVPDDEVSVTFIQRECNYLQALEGEIDTSHFGFLHAGHVDPDDVAEDDPVYHTITNRRPSTIAPMPPGARSMRATARRVRQHLLALRQLPVSVLEPGAQRRVRQSRPCARLGAARRRPHHVLFSALEAGVSALTQPQPAFKDGRPIGGTGRTNRFLANTTDWLGRFGLPRTRATIGGSTAPPSAATKSTAGSTAFTCRIRRSPRAWGRSRITPSSISRRRIR